MEKSKFNDLKKAGKVLGLGLLLSFGASAAMHPVEAKKPRTCREKQQCVSKISRDGNGPITCRTCTICGRIVSVECHRPGGGLMPKPNQSQ